MICQNCGKEIPDQSQFCPICGFAIAGHAAAVAVPVPAGALLGVASTGTRFLHLIVDTFAYYVFCFAVGFVLGFTGLYKAWNIAQMNSTLVGLVLFMAFYVLFEGVWQRSPAKFLTKTKVVMQAGGKPTLLYILGRTLCRLIPFEAFSFLGAPVGWHDKFSKTLVVPASYTEEDIKNIDPKHISGRKTSTGIVAAVSVLIGIILIGILGSIVFLALNSARAKARDAKRLADIRQIKGALDLFYHDKKVYPLSLASMIPNYIHPLPMPPLPPDGNCTDLNNDYDYVVNTSGDYSLSFCLGQETGGYSAGVHYLTPAGIGVSPNVLQN